MKSIKHLDTYLVTRNAHVVCNTPIFTLVVYAMIKGN